MFPIVLKMGQRALNSLTLVGQIEYREETHSQKVFFSPVCGVFTSTAVAFWMD